MGGEVGFVHCVTQLLFHHQCWITSLVQHGEELSLETGMDLRSPFECRI